MLAVLLGALAVALAVTTPWQTLPADTPGGRVTASPSVDFSPAEQAREEAFRSRLAPSAYTALGLGIGVSLLLGLTPLGARLVGAMSLGGRLGWPGQLVVGAGAVVLVGTAVTVPLRARSEAVLRDAGLSTRSWAGFALDQARSIGVRLAVLSVALLVVYALIRAAPVRWWIPVAAFGAGLVLAGSFLYPVLVEPVFNHFTPLAQGELRTGLLDLAARDGVRVDEVLVADASRRTTSLNAYVSGFGSSRRIVVYDTLLKQGPDQVRLIVAHELGHARADDVLHGTLLGALGVAAAAVGGYLLLTWPWLLRRAGVTSAGDVRSVALLLALITLATVATGPLQNLVSRRIEARADVHALDLTRDPALFARTQRTLATSNLSDLDPSSFVYGMFSSHPTSPERIALARTWARQQGVPVPPPMAPGANLP